MIPHHITHGRAFIPRFGKIRLNINKAGKNTCRFVKLVSLHHLHAQTHHAGCIRIAVMHRPK